MKILQHLFTKKKRPKTPDKKLASQIEISGDWTTMFWDKRPVRVYAEPDAVAAVLSQATLPYLWPDEKKYRDSVDSKDDPQRYLRLGWIVVYLHHPNPEVILKTLRDHIPTEVLETMAMTDALADLLVHSDAEVRSEAAKVIWKCSDASIKGVFNILSSQGMIPSGIAPREARRAAEILRNYCPPERRQLFEQLALDAFGPTVAGLKPEARPEAISFKEKITKPGALGTTCTYEVYTAASKLDALSFLESREVTQRDYFVVVETPEGNWGKDCKGIYQEKA